MLLIDYFQKASEYIEERRAKMRLLERQYQRTFDRSAKQENLLLKGEIRKKLSELKMEMLLNLEEMHYLRAYFPELFSILIEDPHIGSAIEGKLWLLDFKPLPPDEAAIRLQNIRMLRLQLKEASKGLVGRPGLIDATSYLRQYPVLRGQLKGKVRREDIKTVIDEMEKLLLREGWLILINDSLIEVALSKFTNKLLKLRYEEAEARSELAKTMHMGNIAQVSAQRKLDKAKRMIAHYDAVIRQLLLSNPKYLRSLKKNTDWLSRKKRNALQKIAETVTPHKVKERSWLDEMNKRLGPR
jgi:hypothetical protein